MAGSIVGTVGQLPRKADLRKLIMKVTGDDSEIGMNGKKNAAYTKEKESLEQERRR